MPSALKLLRPRREMVGTTYRRAFYDQCVKYIDSKSGDSLQEILWVEEPVGWKEFIESPQHLNLFSLTPRQELLFDFLVGDDPKQMFFNGNNEAILAWAKGSLLGGTEFITADGIRDTLENLANRPGNLSVYTKDDNGRVAIAQASQVFKKPNKENCFRVTTSFGHISECSEDHQFFTTNGWKKLKELCVGDWVCSAQQIPLKAQYSESPELCRWIGYVLGDGCISEGHRAQFFVSIPEIEKDYCNIVKSFGGHTRVRQHNTPKSKVVDIKFTGKRNGNILVQHAKRLGVYGHTAESKRIPIEIMYSSAKSRIALIEALYATDGSICRHNAKDRASWEITYLAKNRKFIEDLDFMLRCFGIVGKIRRVHTAYNGEKRWYWKHIITDISANKKFAETFIITGKQHKVEEMIEDTRLARVQGRTCPETLTELAKKEIYALVGRRGSQLRGRLSSGQMLNYTTACTLKSVDKLANEDLLWEQIKSIDALGMHPVYTLTVPGTANYLCSGLFHHNSGKDTLASIFLLYCVYVLLCVECPQRMFGVMEGSNIDCINVAPSGENAHKVFFESLKQRALRWRWLKDKFRVELSGEYLNKVAGEKKSSKDTVTITQDGILFPKQIRLLSRNSNHESAEGYNTLVGILDESDAFSNKKGVCNAETVYDTLKSSKKSRFGSIGKMLSLSFPRAEDGFIIKQLNENLKNLHVFTDTAATWEIRPRSSYSAKTFVFEGREIPVDFQDEFEKNPTKAKMYYLAIPPKVQQGFFEYPDKLRLCADPGRSSLITWSEYYEGDKVCARIDSMRSGSSSLSYVLTLDLGRNRDKAALSMSHGEYLNPKAPNECTVVQDLVMSWIPNKAKKLTVSFINVEQIIRKLCDRYNITGVWFDEWQAYQMDEQLKKDQISSHTHVLQEPDYQRFKEMCYVQRVQLLPYEPMLKEMERLVQLRNRVDHPEGGEKDLADTMVSAVKVVLNQTRFTGNSDFPDVELITPNLQTNMDPWS